MKSLDTVDAQASFPSKDTRLDAAEPLKEAAAILRAPSRGALFLDLDGTLIPIAAAPQLAAAPPGLNALIERLSLKLSGALAIITGRPIIDADRLLSPLSLIMAGVHGAEMRRQPQSPIVVRAESFDADLLDAIIKITQPVPGLIVEYKGWGVAVHYRLAECPPDLLAHLRSLVESRGKSLRVLSGRRVIEILPAGISKAEALMELSSLPEFRGRVPVVIGDDRTDEEAFAAAQSLGGLGLKVAGEYFSVRDAAFEGPASVLKWLDRTVLS